MHDQLLEKLQAEAARRSVGPGIDKCDMGPVISERQLDRIEALIEVGVKEGATLLTGGHRLDRRVTSCRPPSSPT